MTGRWFYVPKRTARAGGRHVRRRKSRLPFYAFVLAIIAFVLAFAFPEERPDKPSGQSLPVRTLSGTEDPVLPPVSQGVEPDTPASGPEDSWMLTLVNPWNPLPEDYACTLTSLSNGHSVDERCYPDLQAMLDACREAGLSPVICSSYRTREKQEKLFQNKVERLIAQGYSRENAKTEAAKTVALPGTSEHQLGLAVDIVDRSNQNLDRTQETTAVQQWLMAHSWEYGFILRYPDEKSETTGIIYEPWHYRYVGKEAAEEIYRQGVCLEEYLDQAAG